MGRRTLKRFRETLHKGINEQAELVQSGECADARNVWAPNGRVVSRPGYESLWPLVFANSASSPTNPKFVYEDNSGASPAYTVDDGTNLTATLATGDRWYYGVDDDLGNAVALRLQVSQNSNTSYATAEYWNGSSWRAIPFIEGEPSYGTMTGFQGGINPKSHMGAAYLGSYNFVWFTGTSDWATTDVSTVTGKYFIRFTVLGNATSALTFTLAGGEVWDKTNHVAQPQYAAGVRYEHSAHLLYKADADPGMVLLRQSGIGRSTAVFGTPTTTYVRVARQTAPPTLLVMPQTEETILLDGEQYFLYNLTGWESWSEVGFFEVEDAEYIVGEHAPYDRNFIAQRLSVPRATVGLVFKNTIFLARGSNVYWSAPLPYYRVWPELNYAVVVEGDPGAITALAAYGEQLIVFKGSNIYAMSYAGETAFGTNQYAVSRVVPGVGCVASASIQAIEGRLIFLADNGLYAFDGTPNVRKVTLSAKGADRLATFMGRITTSARTLSHSIHWREKRCYLLAVPIDGSTTNNAVIVWDYRNDAFWIWDNISVFNWVDGATFGEPQWLYFIDYDSIIHRFNVGRTDHGTAISSYVLSHRIGYRSGKRLRFREVELTCSNKVRSVTSEIWPNERDNNTVSGTVDFTDANETDWDDTITDTTTTWEEYTRRTARMGYRVDCDYAQVKLSHSTANQPFELSVMNVGFMLLGDR